MKDQKRYVVEIQMYVYADNDYMAKKKAEKIAKSIKESEVEVTEIGEQPFASFNYRKLEDCKYYPKDI
jgi:hypothetical protein